MRIIIAPTSAGLRADLMVGGDAARDRVVGGSGGRMVPTHFAGPALHAAWSPSG